MVGVTAWLLLMFAIRPGGAQLQRSVNGFTYTIPQRTYRNAYERAYYENYYRNYYSNYYSRFSQSAQPAVQTQSFQQPGLQQGFSGGGANAVLDNCCRTTPAVVPGCYPLCNFDNFNINTGISLYRSGACPASAFGAFKRCASGGADHSGCCSSSGVHAHCMGFCQPGMPRVGIRQLKCRNNINQIKNCFRNYLDRQAG